MKPMLYIDPSGIVRYNEFPEEPTPWPQRKNSNLNEDMERYNQSIQDYYKALQAAKDSAVECADQMQAEGIIWSDWYDSHHGAIEWTGLTPNTIHPFPSDRYKVEVKEVFERNPDYLSIENQNRDNAILGYTKEVVVITPLQKEESQEERFTIEDMKAAFSAGTEAYEWSDAFGWLEQYTFTQWILTRK